MSDIYGPDVTFDSIEQIRAHQWVGNAASDMKAFNAIHAFVQSDKTTVDDKYEALDIMGQKGMGLDPLADEYPGWSKDRIIDEYLDNT